MSKPRPRKIQSGINVLCHFLEWCESRDLIIVAIWNLLWYVLSICNGTIFFLILWQIMELVVSQSLIKFIQQLIDEDGSVKDSAVRS